MTLQNAKLNTLSVALDVILTLAMTFGLTIGAVSGAASDHTGEVTDDHARFTVITPTLLRLEFSRDGRFINRRSYFAWHRHVKPPQFKVKKQAGKLVIRTARMELLWRGGNDGLTRRNLSIRFRDGKGNWGTWNPGEKQVGNLGGTLRSLDIHRASDGHWGYHALGGAPRSEATLLCDGLLSRGGWYLLKDRTPLLGNSPHPWIRAGLGQAETDWYFFGYGHNYPLALRDLTTVSGRVPIPPRYMLGSWRSRYWSFTARQIRQLVLEYNAHRFPLDVMVLDMGWHTTPHWGSYNWNHKLFPHPARLLAWLHKQGLHVTINIHPGNGIGPWDSCYRAFCKAMVVPPDGRAVPFQPESREFMRNYLALALRSLQKQGVDFWWLDYAGPSLGWLNKFYFDSVARGDLRGASFSRWGGWGDQRYPVSFSGDAFSRWRVLKFEVPFTIVGGNVGAFYWSNDIGGFVAGPTPELFTRWVQFGVLSPVFRTHASLVPIGNHRRPWYYGQHAEHAMRVAYDLRSRLFPYIYTCAWSAWKNSLPLVRPLYLEHPYSPEAYTHPEEYFFGRSLLVSPIVSRGNGPADIASTNMWFPKGLWWNLLTHTSVRGSSSHRIFATLDQIPVFARGGVPLPMQRCTMRMAESPPNPLVVCVFPGPDGHSNFYEDDGITTGYRHGQYATTRLAYIHRGPETVEVQIGPTLGSYKGQADTRGLEIRLPVTARPAEVRVNGHSLAAAPLGDPGFSYNPVHLTTQVNLAPISIRKKTTIDITFQAPERMRSLLAIIVNEGQIITCALAGTAGNQDTWKAQLQEIHFRLNVLRALAADSGPGTSATKQLTKFNALRSQVSAITAALPKVHGDASRIARQVLLQKIPTRGK